MDLEKILPCLKQYIDDVMDETSAYMDRVVKALNYPHASAMLLKEKIEAPTFAGLYQQTYIENAHSGLKTELIKWFCKKKGALVICIEDGITNHLKSDDTDDSYKNLISLGDILNQGHSVKNLAAYENVMITHFGVEGGKISYDNVVACLEFFLSKEEVNGTHIRFVVLN